ncbi:RNP domain-containing protein [Phakopsora pachyrhizi]|nr:RNP domain-containing protein [Phakopsora pachyrhizi]
MGNGVLDSDRWDGDERRRDDGHYRSSASRRSRRSRSRSPMRSRRSKSRSRSPRQNSDRHDRRSSRSPYRHRGSGRGFEENRYSSYGRPGGFSSRGRGHPDDPARRAMNREHIAAEATKRSIKENRVYVGNLAFSVKWSDLKGCGVVEFSSRSEAERAIKELNDTPLFGRQIFVREDREEEARFGSLAISGFGARGGHSSGFGGRSGFGGGHGQGGFAPPVAPCKQLAISGLPYTVGWQDLKDMFRSAGNILRADVHFGPDGGPTGNGMVVFETSRDAQNAITMFNGFEYEGRTISVREDRSGSYNSGSRGSLRGATGGRSMPGGRSGFKGGPANGYHGSGSRDTSNLYGDYSGQDNPSGGGSDHLEGGGGGVRGSLGGRGSSGGGGASLSAQPSQQIFVKNLPWSTSNEDLVELFQTTGKVQNAEVLVEGGRSKGVGVVEFETVGEAETAIAKFQNYSYGGRPLSLEFNGRWREFTNARPGSAGIQD